MTDQYNKRISKAHWNEYFGGKNYCDMEPTKRPSQGVLDSHDWNKTLEEANPILDRVAGPVVLGYTIVGPTGQDTTMPRLESNNFEQIAQVAVDSPNSRIGYMVFNLGQNYDRNDTWPTIPFVGVDANGNSAVTYALTLVRLLHQNVLDWCLFQEEHNGERWPDVQFTHAFDPIRRAKQGRVPVSYAPFGSIVYSTVGLDNPTSNLDWLEDLRQTTKALSVGNELGDAGGIRSVRDMVKHSVIRSVAHSLVEAGLSQYVEDVTTLQKYVTDLQNAAAVSTNDPLANLDWVFATQQQYKAIITAKELSGE